MMFLVFVIFCAALCLVVSSQPLDLLELEVHVYSSKSQLTQRSQNVNRKLRKMRLFIEKTAIFMHSLGKSQNVLSYKMMIPIFMGAPDG